VFTNITTYTKSSDKKIAAMTDNKVIRRVIVMDKRNEASNNNIAIAC
jgi:hypothetical protein